MSEADKKKWTEVAVGAAVAFGVFYLVWNWLGDGGDIRAFGSAGTGGDLLGAIIAGVIALLAMIGRKVLDWIKPKLASRGGASESRIATSPALGPVDGTCAAMIRHLEAGDIDAAKSAFESLAALVGPEPPVAQSSIPFPGGKEVDTDAPK